MILSKTPIRISLFGGAINFPEYFNKNRASIIGGTINKFIYTSLIKQKLKIKNNKITYFNNENKKTDTYVNGGFFVIDKSSINKIHNNSTYWEQGPLSFFAKKKQLLAFKHEGFWKSLDTLKDKNDFNNLYKSKKKSPWKI